jgi:hypothetical protein
MNISSNRDLTSGLPGERFLVDINCYHINVIYLKYIFELQHIYLRLYYY